MGRSQRIKGQVWERTVAKILLPVFPAAKRGIGQTRSASECCDVEGTPLWIEAKCGKGTRPQAALKQATEATDGRPVIAVCKDDRERPFVAMYLDDFITLMSSK